MQICVVGSGGREHAFYQSLSYLDNQVVVWPGNPGIPGSVAEMPGNADLYVIGPEQPLIDGLADQLRSSGNVVCGPGADGARLEGSKAWMKELLSKTVPTADYVVATGDNSEVVQAFIRAQGGRAVVKTDQPYGGKGVAVFNHGGDAWLDVCIKLKAGLVVIEECLTGLEVSVFVLCNGRETVCIGTARDYKRLLDGDKGPNTGGMGAFAPVDGVDLGLIMADIIEPTLRQLLREGIDYRGFLYAGIMLTRDGPKLIEYNARMGDPEAQVVLAHILNLDELLSQAAAGETFSEPRIKPGYTVGFVLAAPGYPDEPRTGAVISSLTMPEHLEAQIFFSGVDRDPQGILITSGGRIMCVTKTAPTLAEARVGASEAVGRFWWPGIQRRHDIAI